MHVAVRGNRRVRNPDSEIEFLPLRHIDPHINYETIPHYRCLFRRSDLGCEMFILNNDLNRILSFIRSHENPSTPLHAAVIDYSYVNEIALDVLIEGNTSNLGISYKRKTALHHAAHSCQPDVIAKLIKYRLLSEKYKAEECTINGEHVSDDPDPNVIELVDDLYKRGITTKDIILSAKLLIEYTLLKNLSLCKNWFKTQRRTIFPDVLQYLQSGIVEISYLKAKKIKPHGTLYALLLDRTKDRNIHCSPLTTQIIIKHVKKRPKDKSYCVFRSSIAESLDPKTLKNKLLECAIYGRSECGRKKVSLEP
ncbi:hypothetical protein TNIN_308901 [Trichonephila inaurata madagascariensis]|uniref:Uncharacterized protein n=1 Tax=Trichonephila inaurata madagascariensis TaxID=2747483 RepID=A0A8X7CSR8_9ARAC|nr:hypothetical protein TNIN_308901 [Trichonephila inaurata madagascariensis]